MRFINRVLKWFRTHRRKVTVALFALGMIPLGVDQAIGRSVFVLEDVDTLLVHDVCLVLGTAPTVAGRANRYYEYRLDTAAELFHAGKVNALLVSGDHGRPDYNEPDQMKRDLVGRGVPEQYITCDYAGFRTLDSVVRARLVFGVDRLVIVSQAFHAERAVFLARRAGIDATAFAARSPSQRTLMKTRLREVLARNLALWDAWTGTEPKYAGPPIAVLCREP